MDYFCNTGSSVANGVVTVTADLCTETDAYDTVLQGDLEYADLVSAAAGETIASLPILTQLLRDMFATPVVADIQQAFMAGASLPLIAYLVSWGYSVVIAFASSNHVDNNLDD